jgi:hypothetical protein
MTLFLNFRSSSRNGSFVAPREVLELANPDVALAFTVVSFAELSQRAIGKDVLFATHGFNVDQEHGARCLARLEREIQPLGSELFIGLLWPGDWWIPAINYPFAGSPAMSAGRELARICDTWFKDAASLTYASHSLGARVILESAQRAARSARTVCLTAAAVNRDCLLTEYGTAERRSEGVSNLASERDHVLKLAYPVGDLLADILHPDHSLFTPALGYRGPPRPIPANARPAQIPKALDYDHGDYLPPGDVVPPAPTPPGGNPPKYRNVAAFIANAFRRQSQPWPP